MVSRFEDRLEAGRMLAQRMDAFAGDPSVVVLGLPRGGVPVAYVVARALHAPLDVFLVRKLGVPSQHELAMGAIASGDVEVINETVLQQVPVSQEEIDEVVAREKRELKRREQLYREGRPPVSLKGKVAVLVDDGLATGSTMRAAVAGVRKHGPRKVVVAVPVASREAFELLEEEADEVICLSTPEPFWAVGLWYEQFGQTHDEEVTALLARAEQERLGGQGADLGSFGG